MKRLIHVQQLNYSIPYGRTILENINFDLYEGHFLGVLGRNGVGKSTLIDIILGTKPITSGTIEVLSENPIDIKRKNIQNISFLSQDSVLKGNITINQFLMFNKSFFDVYSEDEEENLLKFFSLSRDTKIGSLSTGQHKKVQIVAALSSLPMILIIDEITAVLDPETRSQFFNVLSRHKNERKMSIILATNIAEDLIVRADSVLFIDKGIGEVKSPTEILNLFNIEKAV